MLFVRHNSTKNFAKIEAGGKGYNLYLMSKEGLNVPPWIVIGPSIFKLFIEKSKLDKPLTELLAAAPAAKNYKELADKIDMLIMNASMPEEIQTKLRYIYEEFKKSLVAVRSSAAFEDAGGHSFAGQLSSFLYVQSLEEYLTSVKGCWVSAFSERSLVYRRENKLRFDSLDVAVVVQQMIMSEKSGVLFTADPLGKDANKMVINSVYGVGEGLVSGALDADTYFINKKDGKVLSSEIVCKEEKFVQDIQNKGCKKQEVEESLQKLSSLNEQELKQLCEVGKKIEDFYQFPQDVEWAFANNQLYILQSRPITTGIIENKGHLFIWDNSNIVESYGGITKPLTFDFAHYVYHQVYVQFCEILLVPPAHIQKMDFFLKNMLGLFYGRVYYNLLNWYKLTSILPGYKMNRSFMETMMGTNKALEDEIAERVKPPSFQNDFSSKVRKIITGIKFFYYHISIQTVVDDFLSMFHQNLIRFKKLDFSRMPADQIYAHYRELEETMLWRWHAPIINDFLCMVHFGIFKKLTAKWLGHLGESFGNDLLAGNGNLESAEPTKRLIALAGKIDKIPKLRDIILTVDNNYCLEAVHQSIYQEIYADMLDYLDRFGFRCMSEMKLEQKDLHHDPSLLFVFLKNLIQTGQTDLEKYERREKEIRLQAENLLEKSLSGIKKKFFTWSLKHTRKAVRNRENTRFCRTRVYGVVRAMFYGIGSDFTKRGIIEQQEDIFYLSLHELTGALEGTNHIQNLKSIIELRKKEYEGYEKMEDPSSRFMTRGPVYWHNQHFEVEVLQEDLQENLPENQLKGIGCCQGIIEGEAKIVLSSDDDMVLNGHILVTKRTDPGWIPLYPSVSALLVERGGLLSHSAIVAREMGLTTIIGVKGLTKKIKNGMRLRINGETGLIEILEDVK